MNNQTLQQQLDKERAKVAELRAILVSCRSNMRVLAKAAGLFVAGSAYVEADERARQALANTEDGR